MPYNDQIIPTDRQNTAKTTFSNKDIERRPSMRGLYDPEEQKRQERRTYEQLNALQDGDAMSLDDVLTQAKRTLATTGEFSRLNSPFYYPMERSTDSTTTAYGVDREGKATPTASRPISILKPGPARFRQDTPDSAEQHAPAPDYTYRDVAESTAGALGMIPGPIGVAGRLASSGMGVYDIATEGVTGGNVAQAAFSLVDAVPALRALRARKNFTRNPLPREGAVYPQYGPQRAPGGSTALQRAKEQDSMQSLRDTPQTGQVDLTSALDDLGEAPLPQQSINRARAGERFGKTYRSESTADPMDQLTESLFGPNAPASVSQNSARKAVLGENMGRFDQPGTGKTRILRPEQSLDLVQEYTDELYPGLKVKSINSNVMPSHRSGESDKMKALIDAIRQQGHINTDMSLRKAPR